MRPRISNAPAVKREAEEEWGRGKLDEPFNPVPIHITD